MHKATGVVVVLLVPLRLIWYLINVTVNLPGDLPLWQKKIANINFILLYVLMFLMPISGFLMTILAGYNIDIYGLFTISAFIKNKLLAKNLRNIHKLSSFILAILIILHVIASLYHHFIRKDNVLKRMLL